jgi:hypothetical protein
MKELLDYLRAVEHKYHYVGGVVSIVEIKMDFEDWALVAQACNPSYSGGRDQEDRISKPDWANRSQDPILKKPVTGEFQYGSYREKAESMPSKVKSWRDARDTSCRQGHQEEAKL